MVFCARFKFSLVLNRYNLQTMCLLKEKKKENYGTKMDEKIVCIEL